MIEGIVGVSLGTGALLSVLGGEKRVWKGVGLNASVIVLIGTLMLWLGYDNELGGYQWETSWVGADRISILFMALTGLLVSGSVLVVWRDRGTVRQIGLLLLMEGLILCAFVVKNVLLFYICFESVLIPMYLLMGEWGSRERKKRAGYYLMVYTVGGSIWMLLSIILLYSEKGTLDYQTLVVEGVSDERQKLLFLGFMIGCGVKIPMMPIHLWLPEAHVEAPTAGSVMLAGILLKLGSYGILRYVLGLFTVGVTYFKEAVCVIGILGVLYTGLTAVRQTDMKRVIAYGSIGHMNLVVIGLMCKNSVSYEGAVLQMISHGLISGGLFMCVGSVYSRTHDKLIKNLSGVVHVMPVLSMIFLVLTLGNIGVPGTSSFVGEIMILTGVFSENMLLCVLGALSMVINAGYSLWLFNRVMFGNSSRLVLGLSDIGLREGLAVTPLMVLSLVVGLYPELILG